MTSKLLLAGLTAGLLLGASATAMAADAPKPPKLTSGVAKNLGAAQTANNKKDFPAAIAAIEEAKKVDGRTPYDNLMIDRFSMSIHLGMQDMNAADLDAEAAAEIDPTQIPDADKAAVYGPALKLALNTKRYEQAAKYAKLYQVTNPPAADMAVIVQALYLGGDYAGATALAQKNIDTATAAGQKPARNDLDVVMAAQVKQKDEPGAEKTLETLVASYNTAEDWKQLMEVSLTTKGMRDIDYIYMGRLMFLQGGPLSQADASLIGATASKAGLYGDVAQAEKAGGTGFPPSAAKVDADKKTFAQQIAAGAKQNGVYNVKTGEAAYGYGMYSDAEALGQAAKTKGGLQDATEADMLIGMSQTAEGKYADAAQTFGAINQSNPASARVVRLWAYFAKQKANPGTGATAAAK